MRKIRLPLKKRRETYITQFPILMKSLTTESSIFLCIWQQRVLWESGSETYQTYTIDKKLEKQFLSGSCWEMRKRSGLSVKISLPGWKTDEGGRICRLLSGIGRRLSGLTGDESFYLNQDGSLVVVFDEYTVAPGSMGMWNSRFPQRRQALSDNDFDQLNSHQVGCSDISMPSFF